MNYGAYVIKRLPDNRPDYLKRPKHVRKTWYAQIEISRMFGLPPILVRLFVEAGRLESTVVGNRRKVLYDATKLHDCLKTWEVCRIQWKKIQRMKHATD